MLVHLIIIAFLIRARRRPIGMIILLVFLHLPPIARLAENVPREVIHVRNILHVSQPLVHFPVVGHLDVAFLRFIRKGCLQIIPLMIMMLMVMIPVGGDMMMMRFEFSPISVT